MNSTVTTYLHRWIDEGTTVIGKNIADYAGSFHTIADQLSEDPILGKLSSLAHTAGGSVESIGQYFQAADLPKILADAEYFGRERPLATVVGGLLLGIGTARLLKSGLLGGLRRELAPAKLLTVARNAR